MASSGTGGAPAPAEPEGRRPLSVSELNRAARLVLETDLAEVWVAGEVSRFLAHGSGHWYFTLKDDAASVAAVMFRGANRACPVRPADGMQVQVRGRVSLYEARGAYQVLVERLEPAGEGALFAALEKLRQLLAAEGLFEPARKRPLPLLPRRIGVATSPTGAAFQDILRVLATRDARLHVVLAPCRVQGEGAAAEVAAALRRLDALGNLDAVIVGRGGGSLEDLWAFNEEEVVRAIHAMSVPVVSAVGHEIDTTLSDLVADVRAATPSQAAELVSASAAAVEEELRRTLGRIALAARTACERARGLLARTDEARVRPRVEARVQQLAQRVDDLDRRLAAVARAALRASRLSHDGLVRRLSPESLRAVVRGRRDRLTATRDRLAAAARRRVEIARAEARSSARALHALSPLAVLERGYAVVQAEGGAVIRAAAEARAGQSLTARLARGRLEVEVRRILASEG